MTAAMAGGITGAIISSSSSTTTTVPMTMKKIIVPAQFAVGFGAGVEP